MMSLQRILVIHRRSTYTEMVSMGAFEPFKVMMNRRDPLVTNFIAAHEDHEKAMASIRRVLSDRDLDFTWRYDLVGVDPDQFDLVVTVGGDGTVLHASHSIGDTPVLAINSSPHTSVGYFTAGEAADFGEILDKALDGSLVSTRLFRMEVRINGEVVNNRVLNDVLFSHDCPASTTRYLLQHGDLHEEQMSSGVWISTATGSTAAIRAAGGKSMRAGSRRLQFVVREPGPSGGALDLGRATLVRGFVRKQDTLSIRSKTSAARLYIDGPHVAVPVDFGDIVTFSGGLRPINLLGYRTQKNP